MERIRKATTSKELLDALVDVLKEMKPGRISWDDITLQENRKAVLIKATRYIIDNELVDFISITQDGLKKGIGKSVAKNPYLWLADKFPVKDKMIESHLELVLAHGDKPFAKPYADRLIERLKEITDERTICK